MTTPSERARKEAEAWLRSAAYPQRRDPRPLALLLDWFAADAVREEREALADIVFDATGREDLVRVIRARTPASGEEKG